MKCRCAQCGNALRSRPETDNGVLVEVVQPCTQCRRRMFDKNEAAAPVLVAPLRRIGNNTHHAKFDSDGNALCIRCDVVLPWKPGTRGRVPVFCAEHRTYGRPAFEKP